MLVRNRSLYLFLLISFYSTMALSEDWPHWRGPDFNGSSKATNLPVRFSQTENIKWAAALPGPAASTPIVMGELIFLTTFEPEQTNVLALAIERASGDLRWQRVLGKGENDRQGGMENYMASPSPVVDEQRVIFFSGRGELVAFSHDGDEQWRWNIQEKYGDFNYMWGYGSSPLLFGGRLFIQVLHRDQPYPQQKIRKQSPESYLLAIDPSNGEPIYQHKRITDAIGETREGYSTPIPRVIDGREEILVVGGDYLTAHDPQTGSELWRFGDWNPQKITHWRLIPSPVVAGDVILAAAPKHGPVMGVVATGRKVSSRWELDRDTTDTPTPAYYKGRVFLLNGKKRVLSCVDPQAGKTLATLRLPGARYMRASPTVADDKVYCMNADGEVFVVGIKGLGEKPQLGDTQSQRDTRDAIQFQLLHQTNMGGYPARSTIVAVNRQVFIRTSEALYCVGD